MPTLSRNCASGRSPRMSRGTRTAGARRSSLPRRRPGDAPPAIPATRSRSASANASRKPSAGPRRWPVYARCVIAACPRSIGNSPWQWPPTISLACPNCSPGPPHDDFSDTPAQPANALYPQKSQAARRSNFSDPPQRPRPEPGNAKAHPFFSSLLATPLLPTTIAPACAVSITSHPPNSSLISRDKTRRRGQARLGALQRLALRFLVAAQHQRLVRRVEMKPDHVPELLFETLVARQLEGAREMRLEGGGETSQ